MTPSPSGPVIAIVTGSRDWTERESIYDPIFALHRDSIVIHGDADGADNIAESFVRARGMDFIGIPANWKRRGKSAGPIRNRHMRDVAKMLSRRLGMPVVCLAFPLPQSIGTLDTIALCEAEGWEVRR